MSRGISMAHQWFVKRPDGVDGPLTPVDLRQMAGDGRILPESRVSRDRVHWIQASQLKGLGFANGSVGFRATGSAPTDSQPEDFSLIHYLIVTMRIPVGLILSVALTLCFGGWLVLETAVIVITFPLAAIVTNGAWIQRSWMGNYPNSVRHFVGDRYRTMRGIWSWVTDSNRTIDPDAELLPAEAGDPHPGDDTSVPVDSPIPPGQPADTGQGCLGCTVALLVILALIGLLVYIVTNGFDALQPWSGAHRLW
jgi:hypothetical protein